MSIEASHVLKYVVRPALRELAAVEPRIHSEAGERVVMLTCAHETHMCQWLKQRGGGPACGPFQMEKPAFVDASETYQGAFHGEHHEHEDIITDLKLAAMLCRLYYWRVPKPLPSPLDNRGLAEYWYKHWCKGCAGTAEQALSDFQFLALAKIGVWGEAA